MNIKRILGAFLALTMSVPFAMTGCQKEADDIDSQSSIRQNVTLNMYVVTEDNTVPEQATEVQMALNEILLPEYKTTVKINYVTADKYWEEIDKAEAEAIAYQEKVKAEEEAAREAAKQANLSGNKNKPAKEEEVDMEELEEELNEEYNELVDQIFEQKDIVLENPQLDIFVVNSAEKYKELVDAKRLAPLDSYITLENKILNSYIYPTFMTAAKLGGNATYGLPVNKPIGQYEYLVFNKELLDKYNYSSEDLKTLDSLSAYLALIKANEPDVVPLAHAAGPQFFEYFGKEGDALGLTANQIIVSAFSEDADKVVKNHFATIRNYKLAGYIPDAYTEGTKFAVDIRKGYADSPEIWSKQDATEYVCEVYKRPVATNDNTLDSVFVVSAVSKNPQRAAEIIRHFNTDPVLANMLQYGIEGTHYYYNKETDKIKIDKNSGYHMDNNYTGNQYIKYVLDGEESRIEAYKQQNLDSIVSLYYCYFPELTLQEELVLEEANAIAQTYYPGLVAGAYDVETTFAQINAQLAAINVDAKIEAMLAADPELADERFIYSFDEKDEKEEEEAEATTEPDASAEGTENAEGTEEVLPEREAQVADDSLYSQTVFNVDDRFYKFVSSGSAAKLWALQQASADYYDIKNANNFVAAEEVNDLKSLNTEEEVEENTEVVEVEPVAEDQVAAE